MAEDDIKSGAKEDGLLAKEYQRYYDEHFPKYGPKLAVMLQSG
jgi:hypothetical protein